MYVLLQDAIDECRRFCQDAGIDLNAILKTGQVFRNLELFSQYADLLLANDDRKRQFDVFENRQIPDKIKALKNEADLAVANPGALREVIPEVRALRLSRSARSKR